MLTLLNSSKRSSAAVALALALCCCAAAAVSADGASRSASSAAVTAPRGAIQEVSRASYKGKKYSKKKDDYYYSTVRTLEATRQNA